MIAPGAVRADRRKRQKPAGASAPAQETGRVMSNYWREFVTEWRAVTSAMIGLACGLIMTSYAIGIMGPHVIAEFGWSKADLAGVQVLAIGTVIAFPFVGRLTDIIGVKRTAVIGVVSSPLIFFGLSLMNGDFRIYAVFFLLQVILLTTTTPPIYCRVVVQKFNLAKGLALAIAAAGPALLAAIGGPLLNNFVVENGWRAGYVALAIVAAIGGGLAIVLMPREERGDPRRVSAKPAREDYATIFRSRAFWLICGSMLLCNMPGPAMLSQLNLIVAEQGVVGKAASIMVSAYATGMLIGRFISGLALDRFPAAPVAAVSLALTSVGLFMIAWSGGSIPLLAVGVMLVGLSLGAESDIIAYMIHHNFGTRIYSTVFGMTSSVVAISAAFGAGLLSVVLTRTGSYSTFMVISGVFVLIGSSLFLFLPRGRVAEASAA
jgi:predicted MFS family arabinose efflux permease